MSSFLSPEPVGDIGRDDRRLLTTDGPQVQRILLTGDRVTRTGVPGPAAALYVMVTADGLAAKVGALEAAANAPKRLQAVERKQRRRTLAPDGYPIRLTVVAELDGLVLGVHADEPIEWEERWAEVEHLEDAMRLVLARRLGRLSRWPDWIHVDRSYDAEDWVMHVLRAWGEVDGLGGNARGSDGTGQDAVGTVQ